MIKSSKTYFFLFLTTKFLSDLKIHWNVRIKYISTLPIVCHWILSIICLQILKYSIAEWRDRKGTLHKFQQDIRYMK